MPEKLSSLEDIFDLAIVGGGINGAGIARDAALRGYRVLLVEKNDFASGASSKTSKMIHGGLRYLEHGDLRLVWEACRERSKLLELAPHLVRPLAFHLPVYKSSRVPAWKLRLGLLLYDVLAGFRKVRPHRFLKLAETRTWGLLQRDLTALAQYHDATMDDARLVVANLLDAEACGGEIHNYVELRGVASHEDATFTLDLFDRRSEETTQRRARQICICTGAWSNEVLECLTQKTMRVVAPTRGTHVVLPRFTEQAFTLTADADGRVFFVLPWLRFNLVGTTDVPHEASPDESSATENEIDYLLNSVSHYFPGTRFQRQDVISSFSGLRPLMNPSTGASTQASTRASSRTREHAILQPLPAVRCVVGGKYTTYRAVAEEVVDGLAEDLGRAGPCVTSERPLPGAGGPWTAHELWQQNGAFQRHVTSLAAPAGLEQRQMLRLYATYGTRADQVLAYIREDPRSGEPLVHDQPYLAAEALLSLRQEHAWYLDDWYLRRSRMGYWPGKGLEAAQRISELFAKELGWSEAQRRQQLDVLMQRLQQNVASSSPASNL